MRFRRVVEDSKRLRQYNCNNIITPMLSSSLTKNVNYIEGILFSLPSANLKVNIPKLATSRRKILHRINVWHTPFSELAC